MTNNQSATVSPFEPLQTWLIDEKAFQTVSLDNDTECFRNFDPLHVVTYYMGIEWVKTSWT